MSITPLFARVLLEREELKVGNIIIPPSAEKRNAPSQGKVLAVGHTCDASVKALVGKRVLFGKFAGDWIKDGDKEIYVVQDEDILGVIE